MATMEGAVPPRNDGPPPWVSRLEYEDLKTEVRMMRTESTHGFGRLDQAMKDNHDQLMKVCERLEVYDSERKDRDWEAWLMRSAIKAMALCVLVMIVAQAPQIINAIRLVKEVKW